MSTGPRPVDMFRGGVPRGNRSVTRASEITLVFARRRRALGQCRLIPFVESVCRGIMAMIVGDEIGAKLLCQVRPSLLQQSDTLLQPFFIGGLRLGRIGIVPAVIPLMPHALMCLAHWASLRSSYSGEPLVRPCAAGHGGAVHLPTPHH